ncbi:MAG: cryptochrome/photolyase family protein, partial [Cyanobacteria bacterium J06555_12]
CGSNYMLKMSDYKKGDWCDTVDGLYWRFIDRHRDLFNKNPRTSFMTRNLARLKPERRELIFAKAEEFLERCTT